jgi:hypothetical protein
LDLGNLIFYLIPIKKPKRAYSSYCRISNEDFRAVHPKFIELFDKKNPDLRSVFFVLQGKSQKRAYPSYCRTSNEDFRVVHPKFIELFDKKNPDPRWVFFVLPGLNKATNKLSKNPILTNLLRVEMRVLYKKHLKKSWL